MKLNENQLKALIESVMNEGPLGEEPPSFRSPSLADDYIDRAVDAYHSAQALGVPHPADYGDQYSDDIFRHTSARDVDDFSNTDYEEDVAAAAAANGFDPEEFSYFFQTALEAELERLADEDDEWY